MLVLSLLSPQRTFAPDFVVGMCSFRSGRQDTSAMSRSSTRRQRLVYFHVPSQLLGSVSAYSICTVLLSGSSLMRSTTCIASLAGTPESTQWWWPVKYFVSTTSVSPSHVPIDSPFQLGTTTSGSECGRPSV